jgi:hypothetical protein
MKTAQEKTEIKSLRRKLNDARALIVDARAMIPQWPESLAREADRITRDYAKRNLK